MAKDQDKKPTIYDISKAVGVSTATVNRALNGKPRVSEETRKLVLKTAEEMKFQPNRAAKALSRGAIRIGMILCESIPEFTAGVLKGVSRAFHELQDFRVAHELRIIPFSEESSRNAMVKQAMREMAETGCRGIILLPNRDVSGYAEEIEALQKRGVYTATVVSPIRDCSLALSVRSDGKCSGRIAAELLSMMCPDSQVAVFTSSSSVNISVENLAGFTQGIQGTSLRLANVYENHDDPAIAYAAVEHLVNHYPGVRGIYISSANSSAMCKRLEEMGLVGRYHIIASDLFQDLSDNMDKGAIQATLFQNQHKQGQLCVKYLHEILCNERTPGEEILLAPQIILRSNKDLLLANMEEMDEKLMAEAGWTGEFGMM